MKTAITILACLAPLWAQSITPQAVTLAAGQSQQFTAPWPNAQWSTPFSAVGTLSATGLYTAPATITKAGMVIVVAKDPASGASASASVAMGYKAATTAAASWRYQEIPVGSYPVSKPYGTGFVLTVQCAIAPGTVHLWYSGALYYEGQSFYTGNAWPNTPPLAPNVLAALTFAPLDTDPCSTGRPCPAYRVDYQYTSCP